MLVLRGVEARGKFVFWVCLLFWRRFSRLYGVFFGAVQKNF